MIRKLRSGMMPPAGARRPDAHVIQTLAASLETRLDQAAALHPNPGYRPFQRLNRAEYAREVKAVLALDVDVSAFLPPDQISAGFDNVADSQGFSAALMEGYLRAANRISSLAVGDPRAAASATTYKVPRTGSQMRHVEGAPFGTRGGISVMHTFPADGEYSFRMQLHSIPTGQLFGSTVRGELLEVSIDGDRVAVLEINPRMSEADPTGMNITTPKIHVKAGTQRVSAAFVNRFDAVPDDLMPPIDHTLADSQIGAGFGITTLPHLREFAVAGPFSVTGVSDTASRRRIFSCRPTSAADEAACAGEIIRKLATQAYRGPLSAEDFDGLNKFYAQGRNDGGDFESGIRMAVQAILASPRFLFRLEEAPATARPGQNYRITDLDLATRLSFFLWGAGPDEELLKLAQRGTLRGPGVLAAQVKRLLQDPKADALSTRFASQWLRLQDLDKIHPDALLFPYYDHSLGEALKKETELFFDSIVREDRSILDLITADYTFVNERIARHYGLQNVNGPEFRRVTLADENRRGLLGHGSILALTSVADRTSPVLRGKWIMEVLLGVAAAGAAAERAVARRDQGRGRRQDADDPRAHGAASIEPGVHLVPPRDRSAGSGAREFRRHRPLAHSRQRRPGRSGRRSLRRHQDERPGRPPRGAAQAPGHVRPELHRAADDLQPRPSDRVVRHAGDSQDHSRRGERPQPLLGVRHGRGQQPRVPDEQSGGGGNDGSAIGGV